MPSLFARTIVVVLAAAVAPSTYATDLPLPESGISQITEGQWRTILTEVQGTSGVDCHILGNSQVYHCYQLAKSVVWDFAMEGSPAFPAISQAVLQRRDSCFDYTPGSFEVRPYSGPRIKINRSGAYAGNKDAFEKFLVRLSAADKKVLAGNRDCVHKERRSIQQSEAP